MIDTAIPNPPQTLTHARYPAYKDSGVDWLGEIPAHWEVKQIKRVSDMLVSNVDKHTKLNEIAVRLCNYVDVYKNDFITGNLSFSTASASADEVKRFRVRIDDVIITKDSEDWLDIGVPALVKYQADDLICGYHLAMLRANNLITGSFLFRALQSTLVRTQLNVKANGVTRYGLSHNAIQSAFLPLPPLDEQTRIAEFLDRKTAQIDQAIAQKERLIELLNERRQVLIHKAVTRGLNPNVPMKDSGIDWIGEIPAHWEVSRLKYVTEVQSGITLGKVYSEKDSVSVPYLRVANVQDGFINTDEMAEIIIPTHAISNFLLRKDDILVTEGGDIDKLGRGAIWHDQIKPCIHQNHVFAVRTTSKKVFPQFVALLLNSDYGKKYFTTTANKTTNLASTNKTKLGNFPIVIVPLSEQANIQETISSISKSVDDSISRITTQIQKLQELKSTLINSAVTGKIKV